MVQDTKRYTKDYSKQQKNGLPAIRRSDLEELKVKTRQTHLSGTGLLRSNCKSFSKYDHQKEMPVYDAQVNEEIGGDKSELFASIVRKARAKVDQEKV